MTAWDSWWDGPEVVSYKPLADPWDTGAAVFFQGAEWQGTWGQCIKDKEIHAAWTQASRQGQLTPPSPRPMPYLFPGFRCISTPPSSPKQRWGASSELTVFKAEMTLRTLNCQVRLFLPSGTNKLKAKSKYSDDKAKSTPYLALLSLWPEKFELATKLYINHLIKKIGFYFISPEWDSKRTMLFLGGSHVCE